MRPAIVLYHIRRFSSVGRRLYLTAVLCEHIYDTRHCGNMARMAAR